jgi:hypothetical protein
MGCTIKFNESSLRLEFNTRGYRQKILVDLLLNYVGMDFQEIATALALPTSKVYKIYNCKQFLIGEQANDLGQLFLSHFGRIFLASFLLSEIFPEPITLMRRKKMHQCALVIDILKIVADNFYTDRH